jgi:hypothetical protein
MATATVFVDDAVLGRLPPVCAKTGAETVDHLVLTVPVGSSGLGFAWLLVLGGPIGWFVLFLYALTRRDETLTVRLPYSDAAYAELRHAGRLRRNAGLACAGVFLAALVVATLQTFTTRAGAAALAVIGLCLLATCVAETLHLRRAGVGVVLDGSRRWVQLSRVSDAFAAAVARSQRADREAQREVGRT